MTAVDRHIASGVGAHIAIDDRRYINFGGSSYLGLSNHPDVLRAGREALDRNGAASPFPREFGLDTEAHDQVELAAAAYFETPAALYVSCGYLFGLIALAALGDEFDVVYHDELAHYSLREAIAATGKKSHAYHHCDPGDLARLLDQTLQPGERPLVVTDGLFAVLGEIAPVDEIARIIACYSGLLLIDESHSFGVLGTTGRGVAELHNLDRTSVLCGGSLGKAFGTCGGVIPAAAHRIAALRAAPAARGAAPGLPASAAMSAASLQHMIEHPNRLLKLRANMDRLKQGVRAIGLDPGTEGVPVVAFSLASEQSMFRLRDALLGDGIFVYHTHYIGAGAGGVIRCGIFADHDAADIDALIDALRRRL